jgi:hypothetical protein
MHFPDELGSGRGTPLAVCAVVTDDISLSWEWRAFAEDVDALKTGVALPPEFEAIDQTCIICPDSDTRAVIRENTLEIDVLADRRDGAELWRRALTAVFPLCQHDVRDALRLFPVPGPALYRPEYTPFEFVTDVAGCTDSLHIVGVRGNFRRTAFGGCRLEHAAINTAGRTFQTIGIAGHSASDVARAVRSLHFDPIHNQNIVEQLKAVIGVAGHADTRAAH